MELILGLLLFGGFVFFAFNGLNNHRDSPPRPSARKTDPAPRHHRPRHQTLPRTPNSGLPPFDAQTAKTPPSPTNLRGMARVVDGDTLVIQKTQIRLFGVDAPEMNHPYGKNAKAALRNLCHGTEIRAEVTATDSHGRTVAKCYLPDGRDLSAEMVKLGLAIDWPKYSNGHYSSMELPGVRRRLWLADARQKGRMHVWDQFDARNTTNATNKGFDPDA